MVFLRHIAYIIRRFYPVTAGKVYRYERFKFKINNLKRNRNNKGGASIEIKVLWKYILNIAIRPITFKMRYGSLGVKLLKRYRIVYNYYFVSRWKRFRVYGLNRLKYSKFDLTSVTRFYIKIARL